MRNYVHVEAGDVLTLRRSDMAGYMLRIQHPNTNRPDLVMFFTESTKQLLENLFRGIDQEQQSGDEMVGVAGYSGVSTAELMAEPIKEQHP